MMISLRTRRNKVKDANPKIDDQFMVFDNCRDVEYSRRPEKTDVAGFNFLRSEASRKSNVVTMLKDPSLCGPEEEYHYNVVSFLDGNTKERREIIFDTIAFLCDDQGKTLFTLNG